MWEETGREMWEVNWAVLVRKGALELIDLLLCDIVKAQWYSSMMNWVSPTVFGRCLLDVEFICMSDSFFNTEILLFINDILSEIEWLISTYLKTLVVNVGD